MIKAALYARFSTDLQNPTSAEDQLSLCAERAAREGWHVAARFKDEGISGITRDRPGLSALLAQAGTFDVLIAESIDRISRDQEDIAAIYKRLRFARVRIVTLAEGEVSEMTIGFKGTMAAMFIADLGAKTRRGQLGRVKAGRIPGGRSYGYRAVPQLTGDGRLDRGLREIEPAEADIIREVFRRYAEGEAPRAIAGDLNRRGVPSPRGGQWNASTINGSAARANGLLRNRLYIGELVYGRQAFERDPDSRKRVSRAVDREAWTVAEVPALRIVPPDLWEAVAARLASNAGHRPHEQRRARHALSGLVRCGACGHAYIVIGRGRWGCGRHKESHSCDNGRTILQRDLEGRVVLALRDQLLHPDAVAAYVEEYRRAMAEQLRQLRAGAAKLEAERTRVERRIANLVTAIADDGPTPELLTALREARATRDDIAARLAAAKAEDLAVDLHPAAADRYRLEAVRLAELLQGDDAISAELARQLRACIGRITATPDPACRGLHLAIDATPFPETQKPPGPKARGDDRLKLVAGAGFEPAAFRL